MGRSNLSEANRYWAKVDRRGADECWEWTAYRNKLGYGCFGHDGSSVLAHRYGFELAYGSFDPELCVLHHCDNPPCQNPAHLFLGTRVENNADRHQKGRSARGERMGSSVLTEELVWEANRLYRGGMSIPEIADRLGVKKGTLCSVRRGLSWGHLGLDWTARKGRLNPERVRAIRQRFAEGESRNAIAADYSIKPKYVNEIVARRNWAGVS